MKEKWTGVHGEEGRGDRRGGEGNRWGNLIMTLVNIILDNSRHHGWNPAFTDYINLL